MAEEEINANQMDHAARKKRRRFNFLVISILVHIVAFIGAYYLVVAVIYPRPKAIFTAKPPGPANKQVEHKVKMAQVKNTMSAPPMSKRITADVAAKVSLPDMPAMPVDSSLTSTMPGMGGPGLGLSIGSASGTGSGDGPTMFGVKGGEGLKGTFYDLKYLKDGKSSGMTGKKYADIIINLSHTGINTSLLQNYFTAPEALYTGWIFYPNIDSSAAPKAFSLPPKHAALWCIVYSGHVTPPVSGTYKFVGFADDVLAVTFKGQVILDHGSFSSHQVYAPNRSTAWDPKNFKWYDYANAKYDGITWYTNNTTWYAAHKGHMEGHPFQVKAGQSYPITILIGDWNAIGGVGGLTQAQLFLKKEGAQYPKDSKGNPVFPVFRMNTASFPKLPHNKVPPYEKTPPAWATWKVSKGSIFGN